MTVGPRLRELRRSRRLTQAQVAEGINCSANTYSRYESGRREPSVAMLSNLADFYGVSMDYLFGRAPLTESALSSYETEIVEALRQTPDMVQDDILDFLNHKMSKREALRR